MLRVAVVTLGCPKNEVDSEIIKGLLCQNGFEEEKDLSRADIIVVNTCGFIEDAKQESVNTLLEMSGYKENGSCRLLVAAGCLSQRYGKELMQEISGIDAVVGTTSFPDIVDTIKDSLRGNRGFRIRDENMDIPEGLPRVQGENLHYRYLRIAEGCDNYCSYCIIPKLRGKYRSRKEKDIIEEANTLVSGRAREIILVAQDITGYGRDLYNEKRLPALLIKLCSIEKLDWLRLLYCYPEGITEELINTVRDQDKICKYLDIPIQHASDSILKRMNRKITGVEIERLLYELREQIPGLVIRSSVIVGFPGESSEDFDSILSLVRKGYFDRLGVFTYSREENTPAFRMKGHISPEVSMERREILMLEQQGISLRKNHSKIGMEIRVIVDGKENELYYGRTYGDAPEVDNQTLFTSDRILKAGEFVKVRVEHALEYDLIGRVVG
jgi:ribosomal protein S12 methylthiotransferase